MGVEHGRRLGCGIFRADVFRDDEQVTDPRVLQSLDGLVYDEEREVVEMPLPGKYHGVEEFFAVPGAQGARAESGASP